jgi:site-specific recombinase
MGLFGKKKKITNLYPILEEIRNNADKNLYSMLFVELMHSLRPTKTQTAEMLMEQLLEHLQKDKQMEVKLQDIFVDLFYTRDSQSIFTSVGILESGTFFSELFRQIRHSILPPMVEKRSMYYLLERAFSKKTDYQWVKSIPEYLWIEFFKIAAGGLKIVDSSLIHSLTNTLTILSYRVSYLGLEPDMTNQLKVEIEDYSPFIEQNKKIQTLVHLLNTSNPNDAFIQASSEDAIKMLNECEKVIAHIKDNTEKNGTSLGQAYLLLRCSQLLKRIFIIIRFITPGALPQHSLNNAVSLFKSIVESINKRNSVSDLYKKNSSMLAYQIAEHKSASGEHYITTTRNEYSAFFYSAVAGGVIIAFAAVIKALLHKIHMAPFWQYFCYGLNYAIAFVALFITGASLATKQPTMTASALASSLDHRKGGVSLKGLALTFAKVWRSQFASFAGNLIVVFPLAYMLSVAFEYLTGTPLLHDKTESLQALRDQNPLTSLAWLYACFTGVCLFTSGIISGYVDNKVIYGNIKSRMKEHAGLRRVFTGATLSNFSDFLVKNLGGIIGNISLGFMLGYAKMIGDFFGIPFDIRHITISTAYFAFGVDGLGNNVSTYDWIWTTIGVIGIGFFNFLISFGLAFYVAIRSRNVPFSRLPTVGSYIAKYFKKHPQDFIYPPKNERKSEDVFG